MVMGLHHAGLRVIQDVVFNHTSGFGEESNSILDEVVPNYYNRLDTNGNLESASCCADTATEHFMMGKLQQDAVLWNAKKYKIDGFRFDIMSFTFISNLEKIKQALAQLTLEKDGIDGSKIYIYGEGFNFGETANSASAMECAAAVRSTMSGCRVFRRASLPIPVITRRGTHRSRIRRRTCCTAPIGSGWA
jgi:pullulanase